jgi:DNA-directed RNA polymerase subunit beta
VLAHNVVDTETGEIVANANDEITEDCWKLREAGVEDPDHLHQRPRPGAVHLPDAAHRRDADQLGGAGRHLPHDAPGEPPTEDAVETLFNGLFFSRGRYDLSAVGRMKFNRRVGRDELTGPMHAVERGHRRGDQDPGRAAQRPGEIDDIDHLGNRRVRSVGELAENQFRAGLVRVERAVKERLSRPRART